MFIAQLLKIVHTQKRMTDVVVIIQQQNEFNQLRFDLQYVFGFTKITVRFYWHALLLDNWQSIIILI